MVDPLRNMPASWRQAPWLAPGMFYLSLLFLVLLAAVMVLWIDVPRIQDSYLDLEIELGLATQSADSTRSTSQLDRLEPEPFEPDPFEQTAVVWGGRCGWVLLILWPLFPVEQLFRNSLLARGVTSHRFNWLACLIPPLRMGARQGPNQDRLWLPRLGWQTVDRELQRRLEHAFGVPMIWIALLILPVLGLQFYFQDRIVDYPLLRIALHFGTGVIWFAFAFEFIIMVSVARRKLQYCKRHWLDLVIILLPLVSFLRTLRLLRASKLIKVAKLQQLTRLVRVYRLRGLAMRAFRALLLFEVLHRLLRTKPETRLRNLEEEYLEKQQELEDLAKQIRRLKQRLDDAAKEQPLDSACREN